MTSAFSVPITNGNVLLALTDAYETELGITSLAGHTVGGIIGDITVISESEAMAVPGTFQVVSLAIGLFDEDQIAGGNLPEPSVDHSNYMWRVQRAFISSVDQPNSVPYPFVPSPHIHVEIHSMRKIGVHQSLRLIGMYEGSATHQPAVHAAFNTLLLLP